jgi:hypothetical protein
MGPKGRHESVRFDFSCIDDPLFKFFLIEPGANAMQAGPKRAGDALPTRQFMTRHTISLEFVGHDFIAWANG